MWTECPHRFLVYILVFIYCIWNLKILTHVLGLCLSRKRNLLWKYEDLYSNPHNPCKAQHSNTDLWCHCGPGKMSCFWVGCTQQKTKHGPESNKVEGKDQHCRFSSQHCMYVPSFTCMYTCMYARFICTYKYNKIFFIVCILLILVQILIISSCFLQVFFFLFFQGTQVNS